MMMRFVSFLSILVVVTLDLFSATANAQIWSSGQKFYENDQSEIAAFVDIPDDIQLQAVLCAHGMPENYRFTLLLPKAVNGETVIKVTVTTDEGSVDEYAEVSSNSLDMQVDEKLMLLLPTTSKLSLSFDKEDAKYLGVPKTIDVSLKGADLTLKSVASQCIALCLNDNYKCNYPLLSSLLWPQDKFSKVGVEDLDELCTKEEGNDLYSFKFTQACTLALDRFYKKDGVGPLSYVEKLFNGKNSPFEKYVNSWNNAVMLSPSSAIGDRVMADKKDWYLMLYSLAGKRKLKEIPNSFYTVKNYQDDPTTLVYDIDSRYEMELLKYSSVLYRRVRGNINAINAIEKSLKMWQDFYRSFCLSLPDINQAQALRSLIYRQMLMRVWHLSGKPKSLKLVAENAFRQGTNGKTITDEHLESLCSFFEGANGEQFYFGSKDCVQGIENYFKTSPLKTDLYQNVVDKWDLFAKAWQQSIFSNDSLDDAVGEDKRGNLGITLLSLFRIYGFGDYFLQRECISSRDNDICGFEAAKSYQTYTKEFNYRLESIANVNEEDGAKLNEINTLWLDYYHELEKYVNDLAHKGEISVWRAEFVKGVACVIQTNALLNFPYDREQLPDISSTDLYPKDFSLDDSLQDEKMSIEQYKYDDDFVQEETDDPDSQISDDIVVPN